MDNKYVDKLNFVLIWLSFFIATILPFELFLFSYAVLGPLHYLTEINWLNDKNYFSKAKKHWSLLYLFFTLFIAVYSVIQLLDESLSKHINFFGNFLNIFLLTGFLFAISLTLFKKNKYLLLSLLSCFAISAIVYYLVPSFMILVGVFLPTLIHVYVFTLLFMLFGTLKDKSIIGMINILVLIIIPLIIFGVIEISNTYSISEYIKSTYTETGLIKLNTFIASTLNAFPEGKNYHALSEIGMRIQIFIAFAYTYHYLNWFSKTTIIGWKKSLSEKRLKYIVVFWVLAVMLYLFDYKTGMVVLLFLSFLHVFLEFPLNIVTIKSILRIK